MLISQFGHAATPRLTRRTYSAGSLKRTSRVAPGQSPTPSPRPIRTKTFPPSGSFVDAAGGYKPRILTVIRGLGSGKSRSTPANRSQLRRLR